MVENLKVFNFLLIGLTFAVIVDFFVQMAEGYNSGDPLFTTIDELWTSSTMNPSNFGSTQHTNPSQFGTPQHHEHTPGFFSDVHTRKSVSIPTNFIKY